MFIYTVKNEDQYLDLIHDAIKYGFHEPNPYALQVNKNGHSISDSFNKFPIEEVFTQFSVYTTTPPNRECYEWETPGERDFTTEYFDTFTNKEYLTHDLFRSKMKIQYSEKTPKPEDYPIIISWYWDSDSDRNGDYQIRFFDWKPLHEAHFRKETPFAKERKLWDIAFAEEKSST